jgi:outer membrane protein W
VGIWVLLLALLPAVALAETEQRFRIQGTWSHPLDELHESDGGADFTLGADDAFGLRLGYELLFADHWGVELAAGSTRHDIRARYEDESVKVARLRLTPITASVLYHFTPHAKADFYLGGGAAYVRYGDYEITFLGDDASFDVDSDLTFALQTGVDVKLNDRWGLAGSLQWIDTDAKIEDDKLPVSPLQVGAGVVLRF